AMGHARHTAAVACRRPVADALCADRCLRSDHQGDAGQCRAVRRHQRGGGRVRPDQDHAGTPVQRDLRRTLQLRLEQPDDQLHQYRSEADHGLLADLHRHR
ncbi:hypothetical protein LTR94_036640, partial [Friedmanniomyces endolithicus]